MRLGLLAAVAAYFLWGLFPFYWDHLRHVDAIEVIGHRIVWSFFALLIALWFVRDSTKVSFQIFHDDKRNYLWSLLAAILIGTNWLVFIWSVQHGLVIEASLGYFITPLMNVALGVAILGERLPLAQWVAVALAAIGIGYITWHLGRVPLLALTLAASFAIYGIVKKRMPLPAIPGLWLETTILLIPALALLGWYIANGRCSIGTIDLQTDLFILGAGPTTAIPLLLFSYSAQRIPLSQLGLLQYIAPSIQFLVGWLAFNEAVDFHRWVGFAFVWTGLIIFAFTAFRPRIPLEDL